MKRPLHLGAAVDTRDFRQHLRELIRSRPSGLRPLTLPRPERRSLSEVIDGAVSVTPQGEFFVWEKSLSEAHSDGGEFTDRVLSRLGRAGERAHEHPAFGTLAEIPPERIAWIDLETTGLHGRPLFLIGMMQWNGRDLVLRQTFARDYSEERAVLAHFLESAKNIDALVSFNGKCFDWPFLRDRLVYHRLRGEPSVEHVDLLHLSRRRWRGTLPDCRLQTLERYLCGRVRRGDIPSHEIPQRYHDFVHRRDPRLVAPIFHHNRLDLITMAELLVALVDGDRAG
jgi:uncharacterized protein YprB with RNaseH-like and TPR domain